MKTKKRALIITEKDLNAFLWMAVQGAMNAHQLWKAIWSGKTPRYAWRRIKVLAQERFIEVLPKTYKDFRYYRITHKAYTALCYSDLKIPYRIPMQKFKLLQLPHTSVLTDLRIEVEQSGRGHSWIPDRVLGLDSYVPRDRFDQTVPDAIFISKKTGQRIALEYERTRKQRTRVLIKIRAYGEELRRKDKFVDFVLWVVDQKANHDAYRLAKVSDDQDVVTLEKFIKDIRR